MKKQLVIPRSFLEALHHLSLPADDQLTELENMGCSGVIDELALALNDHFTIAVSLLRAGVISRGQFDVFLDLDTHLNNMSGEDNADLWTIRSLKEDGCWEAIRKSAGQLYAELSLLTHSSDSRE